MIPTVLLVDDDANDEELARVALEDTQIPHKLIVVRDGAEAVSYIERTGKHAGHADPMPTVVLLDLKLPKLSGLEVLERIRKRDDTRSLPVIVFTSSNEDNDLTRSYELGANAYVRKPVDFVEYARAMAAVGAFWLGCNATPPGGS